jgi:hypothetical protein
MTDRTQALEDMHTRIMQDVAALRGDLERAIEGVNNKSDASFAVKLATTYALDLVIQRLQLIEAMYARESMGT